MPLYPVCMVQQRGLWSHRVPQHWPDPPHQGAPGGGASAVGDTLNFLLHLTWVLTSQTCHLATSHPARLAGASGGHCLSKHPFLSYPQVMRGYMPLLPGRASRQGLPPNSVPMVWCCLRISSLMCQGPGSPVLATTGMSAAATVLAAA